MMYSQKDEEKYILKYAPPSGRALERHLTGLGYTIVHRTPENIIGDRP